MPPRATVSQDRAQRRIAGVVDASVRRLWRRMRGRNWETTWRDDVGPAVVEVVTAGQAASVARSETYVAQVLSELDMPVDVPTSLSVESFVGVTGGGVPVDTAAYGAVVDAAQSQYDLRESMAPERASEQALSDAEDFLAQVTASIMADTMRAAEEVAMAERPWVDGYIRTIEAGACSRCAVLAGRFYLFNEGFARHPRCRCNHVPAPNDPKRRADLMSAESPERYFESLTEAEQNRIFTTAGAEAIRLGADIGQVVNARRGMSTSQGPSGRRSLTAVDVYGRPVYVTTEGTTRRGFAYNRLVTDRNTDVRRTVNGRRQRVSSTNVPRLMPETILAVAADADERIRLLRLHGYIV